MRHLAVLAVVAVLLPIASAAQETPNPIDCNNARSTVEINYCADRDYVAADRVLNEAYQTALAQTAKSDNAAPYAAAAWQRELRASQRAWVAFRDADCKGLVPMGWSGGSGTSAAVLSCMMDLTKARTQALQERYGKL
jgi:uncharacterized protein YecT (DUF1311 family)